MSCLSATPGGPLRKSECRRHFFCMRLQAQSTVRASSSAVRRPSSAIRRASDKGCNENNADLSETSADLFQDRIVKWETTCDLFRDGTESSWITPEHFGIARNVARPALKFRKPAPKNEKPALGAEIVGLRVTR